MSVSGKFGLHWKDLNNTRKTEKSKMVVILKEKRRGVSVTLVFFSLTRQSLPFSISWFRTSNLRINCASVNNKMETKTLSELFCSCSSIHTSLPSKPIPTFWINSEKDNSARTLLTNSYECWLHWALIDSVVCSVSKEKKKN